MTKVLKFGGTSVGSAKMMKEVADIITRNKTKKVVVLSAMSGVTDQLLKLNNKNSGEILNSLQKKFEDTIDELLERNKNTAKEYISEQLKDIAMLIESYKVGKEIVVKGEQISTFLFNEYLKEQGYKSELVDALDFVKKDENGTGYIEDQGKKKITELLESNDFIITQGYICRDQEGKISNLGRGGSDYSATILGSAINSSEVEIRTDVSGIYDGDPRILENCKPIGEINYDEATELAFFGAKVLHPKCIDPCKHSDTPIVVKNTNEPDAPGTKINNSIEKGLKAVATRRGVAVMEITGGNMNESGVLARCFNTLHKLGISVDFVSTTESKFCATINTKDISDDTIAELKTAMEGFNLNIEKDKCIVSIVGTVDNIHKAKYQEGVFFLLAKEKIPIGVSNGRNNNFSFIVDKEDQERTIQALHNYIGVLGDLHSAKSI